MTNYICSICNEPKDDKGNNARPLNNGTCCDTCNQILVIPKRISLVTRGVNIER